jgi:hypothetical protein
MYAFECCNVERSIEADLPRSFYGDLVLRPTYKLQ